MIRVVMLGPSLAQQGGMATVENLIAKYPSSEVDICHISTHEEGTILHRLKIFGLALAQFLGKLLQGHLDILHLHVSERGSVVRIGILAIIGILLRKPVIMHTHGCEFHLFYDRLSQVGKRAIAMIFQRCDYVIALSDTWKQYYVTACDLAPDRVIVLYNPVEIPKQIPIRTETEKVHFVFLGRVGQRKGAFDLVQAFSSLAPEYRLRSQLTLAGDGEVDSLRELVKLLDLHEQVQLPGWINVEQRNQLLAQSDVFILPSYHEGLPVALLEAMTWELPVITTPTGGIPEVVSHQQNGLLVHPGDLEQIMKAMQTLIENQSLRLALGKAAKRTVAGLSIDQYFIQLRLLYQAAMAGELFLQGDRAVERSLFSTR